MSKIFNSNFLKKKIPIVYSIEVLAFSDKTFREPLCVKDKNSMREGPKLILFKNRSNFYQGRHCKLFINFVMTMTLILLL